MNAEDLGVCLGAKCSIARAYGGIAQQASTVMPPVPWWQQSRTDVPLGIQKLRAGIAGAADDVRNRISGVLRRVKLSRELVAEKPDDKALRKRLAEIEKQSKQS